MSIRLSCRACRTAFLTPDDRAGQLVTCPKCDAEQLAPPAPAPEPFAPPEVPETSVFVPMPPARRPRRVLRFALIALLLPFVAAVAVLIQWPSIRARLHPEPVARLATTARPAAPTRTIRPPEARWARPGPVEAAPAQPSPTPPPSAEVRRADRALDPVEAAASGYLQALVDGNEEASHRLGTVDGPPSLATFRDVRRDAGRDAAVRGSFAPIAGLHARIDGEYAYDAKIGRFTPRNAMGTAADTLDALHAAKEKAEKDDLYKKIAGGSPDDLFDAAEQLGKVYVDLSQGILSPKKLIPTYKHLVQESKPPLPASEAALALDYAEHRPTWDALLGRPFLTLKSDGPFTLERAEVTASVADKASSYGDPPAPLRLELTRFRLEGIDTGWRVTAIHREPPPQPAEHPAGTQPPSNPSPAPPSG